MTSMLRRGHDIAADAKTLRALHVPGDPLLLANIWDPASARVVEAAGVRAIATASAALAPINGYEDHGRLPPDIAFGALGRIAEAVTLPVTADLEDGYGLSAAELVDLVVGAGVCGCNLEDTDHLAKRMVEPDRQAERIAAIRSAAHARGFDLVINARIDVLFHDRTIDEGVARAKQYFAAGADCVYPIGVLDVLALRQFAGVGPTNVLYRPGGLSLGESAKAGAARISVGPFLFQAMLKRLQLAAEALCRGDDEGVWKT